MYVRCYHYGQKNGGKWQQSAADVRECFLRKRWSPVNSINPPRHASPVSPVCLQLLRCKVNSTLQNKSNSYGKACIHKYLADSSCLYTLWGGLCACVCVGGHPLGRTAVISFKYTHICLKGSCKCTCMSRSVPRHRSNRSLCRIHDHTHGRNHRVTESGLKALGTSLPLQNIH